MNITFQQPDRMSDSFINVTGSTTKYGASFENATVSNRGYSLDISSFVTDNKAYKGQGMTIEELKLNAQNMDVSAYRDYMTVMSNCVSDEDLKKIEEEGFNPGSTDFDEVVTIVDHIKAALVKGGNNVYGYTDDISKEALLEITGSETYANELSKQFMAKDIPLTEENAKSVEDNFKKLESIGSISDGARKYLIENNLRLSVDNLYTAAHLGGSDSLRQPHGYYDAGESTGYYAKKPDSVDIEAIRPQMEAVISNASYEVNKENLDTAAWMVKGGIPLTEETFKKAKDISLLKMPMSHAEFADHATDAISDAISVGVADLSQTTTLRNKAQSIYDEVQTLGTIKGRRVLEEVRLSMTVEANLKLLRSGFAIDTSKMEELVKKLKENEKEFAINLSSDENEIEAVRKKDLFTSVLDIVDSIKVAPVNISFSYEKEQTLTEVSILGNDLRAEFARANEKYEELMTSPRRDLGDSIKKAFSNIDSILESLDMDATDENQRAVRILGYNSIEITKESIRSIKEKDSLLTGTLKMMTPGRVLSMIRSNMNPTTMSIAELNKYLSNMNSSKDDMLSYSKFLYKLEKDNKISEEEKESYIGIYRLLRQIEKDDFASVGAVDKMEAMFSLENMLSTVRSRKKTSMDYQVDSTFGGVEVSKSSESITDMIAKAFDTNSEELKNMLDNAGNKEAYIDYEKALYKEIRSSYKTEEALINELRNYDMALSSENIENTKIMFTDPVSPFEKLRSLGYKKPFGVNLEDKKKAKESYKEMTGSIKDFLENEVFGNSADALAISSNRVLDISRIYGHFDYLEKRSDDECYEIPTEIGGKPTAINLKIVHGDESAKVAISFVSDVYGELAAEFHEEGDLLSGYCSVSNKEGALLLTEATENLRTMLKEAGIEVKDVFFTQTSNLKAGDFSNKASENRKNDTDVVSTEQLYKAAKTFIEFTTRAAG